MMQERLLISGKMRWKMDQGKVGRGRQATRLHNRQGSSVHQGPVSDDRGMVKILGKNFHMVFTHFNGKNV